MVFRRWIITGIMAALALFFTQRAVSVWTPPSRSDAVEAGHAPAHRPAVRRTAPRGAPPLRAYQTIAQHNLFASDRQGRRPASGAGARPSSGKRYAGQLRLLGVVIHSDDRAALMHQGGHGSNNGDRWVRVGDKIDQLMVEAVKADRVIVGDGSQTYEIPISEHRDGASRPDAPPPPKVRTPASKRPAPLTATGGHAVSAPVDPTEGKKEE